MKFISLLLLYCLFIENCSYNKPTNLVDTLLHNKNQAPLFDEKKVVDSTLMDYDTLFQFKGNLLFIEYMKDNSSFHGVLNNNKIIDFWTIDNFYTETLIYQKVVFDELSNNIVYSGSINQRKQVFYYLQQDKLDKKWFVINKKIYIQDESENNIPKLIEEENYNIKEKRRFSSFTTK